MSRLCAIVTAREAQVRDTALEVACSGLSAEELLLECRALEDFRRRSRNLYERVRALLFLYAVHRFELPRSGALPPGRGLPWDGLRHLLDRRFEEAITVFLRVARERGIDDALASGLAAAYRALAFQTLADQVRQSVRSAPGNRWMFRVGHPHDQPLRVRRGLLERPSPSAPFPVLHERTPVRLDLSHSAWSDIFFLGMDFPEGARVVNASIDLAVRGRDARPEPPIESWFRVLGEPVVRLCSVDLGAQAEIRSIDEAFDFAKDHLGLLKAAVIASGLVPPGLEGSQQSLAELLERLVGEGLGFELVTRVRGIPKGSRLAVSTNLLASAIAVCMRATGQAHALAGRLAEVERRTVAARAILGEWLGGSGGGWQDSGGVWPGIKLIRGELAREGDPEFGISRGRLLPVHELLHDRLPQGLATELQQSLVLVHGGMAQNVGPVLETVTEKYLLRSAREWQARREAMRLFDRIVADLERGDVADLARATTENFFGPIAAIVPWASNAFTETVIARIAQHYGAGFRGFCMLGGMAGGGMGFFFDPALADTARDGVQRILLGAKRELEDGVPFAIDPVVYDFTVDEQGTVAELLDGARLPLPLDYWALVVPDSLRRDGRELSATRRTELERLGVVARERGELRGLLPALFDALLPAPDSAGAARTTLDELLARGGFDRELHEKVRADLRAGRIGLAHNRLPAAARIEDVSDRDVVDTLGGAPKACVAVGRAAIRNGEAAVITLAAGAASRWAQGAGVVKAVAPFWRHAGRHRTFVEVHLRKSRRSAAGGPVPHVFTTSVFTHDAIARHLERHAGHGRADHVHLSPGRAVGLRLVPMERDLRFLWEETAHQVLDEQAQKVRESAQAAWIAWARAAGEGSDYTDNVPERCLHPVGHWFEVPNLLRNGVLRALLTRHPHLRWLLVHNVDSVGVDLDPGRLGLFIERGRPLAFEVIPRRVDDRGGGLARVDGRARLVEGLALPDESTECGLRFYNTGTSWIDLDALLGWFGLGRDDLGDEPRVARAVRDLGARMPSYVTIKEVEKRWGNGHEDIFPVAQFEKLWGDMTALPGIETDWHVVPRERGQQLKDPALLDGFLRDGSAEFVAGLCVWD